MNKRHIGTSDLHVSEIGFGCMSLDIHSPNSSKLLQKAFDSGINFFDTADLYHHGENEKLIGRSLKEVRNNVIIATKVGNQWRKDGSGWDWNPTKPYILQAVEDSLRRLQTDYIDLYQLHGGTIDDPIDETIEAFEILRQQGKIREYGISSIRPNVIKEWVKKSNMVSVMMQYSLLDRRPEEEIIPLLQKKNISLLARGTLAKGLLINKPATQYLDYTPKEIKKALQNIKNMHHALSSSLAFVLNEKSLASAVVGTRSFNQLNQIITSIQQVSLSSISATSTLDLTPLKYITHR